jgi:peptide/nickel transport system ATP-binding protein
MSGDPSVAKSQAADREPTALLELRQVVKEFPITRGSVVRRKIGTVKAVSNVSLAVQRGEIFGLVGESGCGKTTIGRMIVGLENPTAGEIRFEGVDLARMSRKARHEKSKAMQLMFQDPYSSLDPRMRVGSILAEPLVIQRIGSRSTRHARVRELLAEVSLGSAAAERYPHEFSGGQRQRIGLARALALNPKLIVADEPVSALDVSIRSQILNLMLRLQRTHNLTYVVISHDLSVIRYVSDRIGVMYLGKLVEVGPAQAVYQTAAHPYTAGLLRAVPAPDPAIERAKQAEPLRGEPPSSVDPPSGCRFRTRCPRAQDLCAREEPPLRHFVPGQLAACHFPLQDAV